ncbi:unnamed protein product [Cladocopium goreaui]|uniref:Uncharacterized protein n=1 Tax=Cladocopium goreaui TaxID=2562237 RepID=A0A9P1DQ05_9DINO|nr:unnamed protein product [Cladocopium goreaui]
MENVETQLADHYEYAAWLCERLDNMTWMRDAIHALGERLDQLANRIATNADDTRDALTVLDDATDVVRYGLMEFGGFVRNQSLTGQQRTHMFTQERANFVLWNMQRNRPDDTDPLEDAEEERLTDDEVEPSSTEGMSNLMEAMRREQNIALTREAWEDASMIQQALITILDASEQSKRIRLCDPVVSQSEGDTCFHYLPDHPGYAAEEQTMYPLDPLERLSTCTHQCFNHRTGGFGNDGDEEWELITIQLDISPRI